MVVDVVLMPRRCECQCIRVFVVVHCVGNVLVVRRPRMNGCLRGVPNAIYVSLFDICGCFFSACESFYLFIYLFIFGLFCLFIVVGVIVIIHWVSFRSKGLCFLYIFIYLFLPYFVSLLLLMLSSSFIGLAFVLMGCAFLFCFLCDLYFIFSNR